MISITKIFRFEMAHALHKYPGKCKDIHGHSYELQITVSAKNHSTKYFESPGILMDFKDLKQIVCNRILSITDHKLMLSKNYLNEFPAFLNCENLVAVDFEPSAENLLIYIFTLLNPELTDVVKISKIKLYETKDSFAEINL